MYRAVLGNSPTLVKVCLYSIADNNERFSWHYWWLRLDGVLKIRNGLMRWP